MGVLVMDNSTLRTQASRRVLDKFEYRRCYNCHGERDTTLTVYCQSCADGFRAQMKRQDAERGTARFLGIAALVMLAILGFLTYCAPQPVQRSTSHANASAPR